MEIADKQYCRLTKDLHALARMCTEMGFQVERRIASYCSQLRENSCCYQCSSPPRVYIDLSWGFDRVDYDILWDSEKDEEVESEVREWLAKVLFNV